MKSAILQGHMHLRVPLALIIISLALQMMIPVSSEAPDYEAVAIDYVSSRYGVAEEELTILHSTSDNFPLTGVVLWNAKVYDRIHQKTYGVSVRQSGEVFPDSSSVRNAERSRYLELYGRMSPSAVSVLSTASPSQLIDAAIWLGTSNDLPPSRDMPWEERMDEIQARNSELTAPLMNYLLTSRYGIKYVSPIAPILFASIPAEAMNSIAHDPLLASQLRIGFLDIDQKGASSMVGMDSIKRTVLQDIVIHRYGFDGSHGHRGPDPTLPVRVAVTEEAIDGQNQYLMPASVTYYNSASKVISDHATHVAGVIAESTGAGGFWTCYFPACGRIEQDFSGMAPGADLLSANVNWASWSDSTLVAATDWAVLTGGADVVNHSYWDLSYDPNAFTAYIDYLVWHLAVTQTIIAGNNDECTGGCGNKVLNPGITRNAITVGGFSDQNTPEWSDDQFSYFSNYLDPTASMGSDFNKPEVVAVAEKVFATGSLSRDRYDTSLISGEMSGTSFAAPQVAGLVATLIDHGVPSTWPEPLKAIVMASAVHRLSVDTNRQGAGAIVGQYAHDIITNGWWQYHVYNRDPGWPDTPINVDIITVPISLMRGEHFKGALVWDDTTTETGTYPDISSYLGPDLDLYLYDPGGSLVAQSTTSFNTYEWFDYIAAVPGTYTLKVRVYEWPQWRGLLNYIGLAWWHDLSLAELLGFTARPTDTTLIVAGDIAVNPHGTKPSGVVYQQGRDTTPAGVIIGMLGHDPSYGAQENQTVTFDTYSYYIDPSGRPSDAFMFDLVWSVGGPGVNAVTYYYENTGVAAERAPVTFGVSGSNFVWTDRNGYPVLSVPQSSTSVPPGTSDVFVIQILRDEGRGGGVGQKLVVLIYGTRYTGTWAAAWYFKNIIYRQLSMYGGWQDSYYIVSWTDNGDYAPGYGDTFNILAYGSPP